MDLYPTLQWIAHYNSWLLDVSGICDDYLSFSPFYLDLYLLTYPYFTLRSWGTFMCTGPGQCGDKIVMVIMKFVISKFRTLIMLHFYFHYFCNNVQPGKGWAWWRHWPFVQGIHRSPVNSPHKDEWRGALIFSLIWAWTQGWANHRDAGDLRRHRAHHDVTVK